MNGVDGDDAAAAAGSAPAAEAAAAPPDPVQPGEAGGEAAASDRPSNEEIVAQENEIRREQEQRDLLGPMEPLASLSSEYVDEIILSKIAAMAREPAGADGGPGAAAAARDGPGGGGGIRSIRRTRGDGNCFYRAFIYGYLEAIVRGADASEAKKARACLRDWGGKLKDHGFQEIVYEDALAELSSQLEMIADGCMSLENLTQTHNNPEIGNYIIMLLRFITSSALQTREDFFAPFVVGMTESVNDVTQFCRQCVEPMGEESDHAHIIALTDALQGARRAAPAAGGPCRTPRAPETPS